MIKQPQPLLKIEFFLLYAGVPVLLIGQSRSVKLATIWAFALFAVWMLRQSGIRNVHEEWNWAGVKAGLPGVLKRFAPCTMALTGLLFVLVPERFLSFPMERPGMWALVMLCYPILSVLPQELVYRSLYHHRYAKLFHGQFAQLMIAGIIFGWAHIMFMNWVSPLLCAFGGILFSRTYMKHKSLALAFIEHSLYGCFIFTLGLGVYFYGVSIPAPG